jgi:hypothetical protein
MYTLNLNLSAADLFFGQTLYSHDWDKYSDSEKNSGLFAAQKAFEQNSGTTIQQLADSVNTQPPFSFNEGFYMQAFMMLENADRYRNTSGPLAIMSLAEGKNVERIYRHTLPNSYLYPESLAYICHFPTTLTQGRG